MHVFSIQSMPPLIHLGRQWGIARLPNYSISVCLHGTGLAQVGVDVGLVNDEGLRGTTAARNFQQGEVVVRVPRNCTLALGPHAWTPAVRCLPPACVPLTWHSVQCWRADALSPRPHACTSGMQVHGRRCALLFGAQGASSGRVWGARNLQCFASHSARLVCCRS